MEIGLILPCGGVLLGRVSYQKDYPIYSFRNTIYISFENSQCLCTNAVAKMQQLQIIQCGYVNNVKRCA